MKGALASWSGGKDSCFALMQAVNQGMQPRALLNMMNENGKVSRSHAIPRSVLQQQARAMGDIPLYMVPASWSDYEREYIAALKKIERAQQIECVIFGDIDLEPHREWEEKVSRAANLEAVLPLWQMDRITLVHQMIAAEIEAVIVSCNTKLGLDFLGRGITAGLIEELTALGIDACGENGEFHTLVLNCPLFSNRIDVIFGEKLVHQDYCFIEMIAGKNE
ncbi:diphthine--ammonia ligase [Fulvivirgaceae bacterium BMA12]|uniref:Diphthine--ammonia ligase n=1 Tax=Agaribacillus aureus TaxID=3051825 RepID=A0ABT8L3C6_9BACT|nr:diphthine--ammonia ligase [Fulvivirgaceae bacterium BMA12]